jgi:hypothetical protein
MAPLEIEFTVTIKGSWFDDTVGGEGWPGVVDAEGARRMVQYDINEGHISPMEIVDWMQTMDVKVEAHEVTGEWKTPAEEGL